MKRYAIIEIQIKQYLRIVLYSISVFIIVACQSHTPKIIPLEELDPKFKNRGELIVKDILESLDHFNGAQYLLKKEYITPKIHGRIVSNSAMYREAYAMAPSIIGNITDYKLVKVVDKTILKTMYYTLKTDDEAMEVVELKLDINNNYRLSDFYLYATSTDGSLKRVNILPESIR